MTLYDEDLAHIQDAAFGGYAESAMPSIVARLRAARPLPRCILDVGCGAGVSTLALVREGFDVLALDPSPPLLERAQARAPGARFQCASVFEIEVPACDAVIAIGESLTYHSPEADADARLRGFFRAVGSRLPRGGLLIFDAISSDGPSLERRDWRSEEDWAILHETRERRPVRQLTRTIETFRRTSDGFYRRAQEVHEIRTFEERALREWLDLAGFDARTEPAWGPTALLPRRLAFVAVSR